MPANRTITGEPGFEPGVYSRHYRAFRTFLVSVLFWALLTGSASAITGHRALYLATKYQHSQCGTTFYDCEFMDAPRCFDTGENAYHRIQWSCVGYVAEHRKYPWIGRPFRFCTVASGWSPWGVRLARFKGDCVYGSESAAKDRPRLFHPWRRGH